MIGEGKQITGAIIHVGILLRSVILHPGGSAEDVVGVANDKSVSVSHRQQPTGLILVGVGGKSVIVHYPHACRSAKGIVGEIITQKGSYKCGSAQEMSILKSRFQTCAEDFALS